MHKAWILCLIALIALSACGPIREEIHPEAPETEPFHSCGPSTAPKMAMIRKLSFVGTSKGVTRGFNIDGIVSASDDPRGCKRADLVSEDGVEGIDNQFGVLLPALNAASDNTIDALMQRTINEGSVLMMIDMRRMSDEADDDCVQLNLWRAKGKPIIGSHGYLESGQTFDWNPDEPSSHVLNGVKKDGVVTAGPVDLPLPFEVGGFALMLNIRDATISVRQLEDGSYEGYIGGSLVVQEIYDIINELLGVGFNEDATIRFMKRAVSRNADLNPNENGTCQGLSVTLGFEAVDAFFYEDQALPDVEASMMASQNDK